MKRPALLVFLAAGFVVLLLIELNSIAPILPEASECAQLNWVTDFSAFNAAWDSFLTLHAPTSCVDLNIFLIEATHFEQDLVFNAVDKASLSFRRVIVEGSRTVSESHTLEHLNIQDPSLFSFALLSLTGFCLSPSFLVAIERLHEQHGSIGVYELCQGEHISGLFLVSMPTFLSGLWDHPMSSLSAIAKHVNALSFNQSSHVGDQGENIARCHRNAECDFVNFAEIDHVQDKLVTPASTDKCTMILTIFARYESMKSRLKFYESLSVLAKIFVVWNNVEHDPPSIKDDEFRIPVHVENQRFNSMNNRFKPHPFIDTDCVMTMDDDWDMPHVLIEYSVQLWKLAFKDNLVGLWKLARLHGLDETGQWTYLYNKTMPQSIVLPSGMVFHRKYLDIYTNKLPTEARKLVDDIINCDDILFNYMIANITRQAPVFVDHGRMEGVRAKASSKSGLWSRRQHLLDRHRCLQEFNVMFGDDTLKYTTSRFSVGTIPDPSRHTSIDIANLRCQRCSGPAIDDCVTCQQL